MSFSQLLFWMLLQSESIHHRLNYSGGQSISLMLIRILNRKMLWPFWTAHYYVSNWKFCIWFAVDKPITFCLHSHYFDLIFGFRSGEVLALKNVIGFYDISFEFSFFSVWSQQTEWKMVVSIFFLFLFVTMRGWAVAEQYENLTS